MVVLDPDRPGGGGSGGAKAARHQALHSLLELFQMKDPVICGA